MWLSGQNFNMIKTAKLPAWIGEGLTDFYSSLLTNSWQLIDNREERFDFPQECKSCEASHVSVVVTNCMHILEAPAYLSQWMVLEWEQDFEGKHG